LLLSQKFVIFFLFLTQESKWSREGKPRMNPVSLKTPISLLVDDSAPLAHVYKAHAPATKDGRPLLDTVPNAFLEKFCGIVERHGVKGKFTVVPMPAGLGDIVNGIPGYDLREIRAWIETANRRLGPFFDFSPEVLTHARALDLRTGQFHAENEMHWSFKQDRNTLAPYIAHALRLLKDAGLDANGVTSPWSFGMRVEDEYAAAIMEAQRQVYGRNRSWYFLHVKRGQPGVKPAIARMDGAGALVSIPATVGDHYWKTIDTTRADGAYVSSIADAFITGDGTRGEIVDVLDSGGWPVIVTHWQSLFSNGLETGLRALETTVRRVEENLGCRVEWKTCMEMAGLVYE